MRKILSILLIAALLIVNASGCKKTEPTINPEAVLYHLLTDIQYDAELVDSSDLASIYFPNLPGNATVRLYVSSSGYFPDEVAMITLANEQDTDATNKSIQAHLDQVRNQFVNYIPEEVATIDNAVTWQSGNHIYLVITSDHEAVNALFKRAHEFTDAPALPSTDATATPTTSPAETLPPETLPLETIPLETISPTETESVITETTEPEPTEPPEPTIPTLQSQSGAYSSYRSGVVKVDNSAFEPYFYDSYVAGTYATLINKTADQLSGYTNVYCMPIPTAISVVLPDDIMAIYPKYRNQGEDIENIFSKMNGNVTGINCYDNLMLHRDEYLYFRTDYHWNGPAAYYAYEAFCEAKGFTPYTMEERRCIEFDGFLGSLYQNNSGKDPDLAETPDTVIAYYPYSPNATMSYHDTNGNIVDWPIISNVSKLGAGAKYYCFAGADQPFAEFYNPDATDGNVLIIVKESYGNVLMSYLVDHYTTIYEIDYRYWTGNIVDFAKEVGADDLIFTNNMTMISAGLLVGMLSQILP